MKKSLRSIVSLLVFVTITNFCIGQQQNMVTGKIVDAEGLPMLGVNIVVDKTTISTVSNKYGDYSIPATVGDRLIFTTMGYATHEELVGTSIIMNVSLKVSSSNLNEVVVTVAYGTARKKDLTGSLSIANAKDFQGGVITTPEQLIAGKVPGVSIISNGGQPGSGSTIRVRGGSSLSASNNPLIVLDGVPLDNDAVSGASNPLSFINPNDVESFTVLKDASAAAIYGTRAANGVIIITTKKGKSGALKVSFSSVNSLAKLIKKVDVLSADQFRAVVNEKGAPAQKAMLGTANTDWQNIIYQTAFATDNNISISGGAKNFPVRLSLGYLNQDGILKTDNLSKASIALVLNPTFFDNHLKVDINLKASMQNTFFANNEAIGGAVSFDPTQPVYATIKKERFGGYYEWLDGNELRNLVGRNPLGLLEQRFSKAKPQRSIGNIQFDYKFHFLPELRAKLNIGYDVSKSTGTVFVPDSAAQAYIIGGTGGTNDQYKQTKQNTLLEFYFNYIKELKSINSKLDVIAGYSYNDYLTTNYNFARYNAKAVKYVNSDPTFPFDKPQNVLISFFGRVNYSLKDRYLLTATLRRDGSSRFSPNNRWGLFPSIAAAWNIKEVYLLKNNPLFSQLKIRASYGITGQQDGIGSYDYLSYFSLSDSSASYQFGNKYYRGYKPGGFYANRKWEETATSNIALDFGFYNNRITGSIDLYVKKTKDLLNNLPQPAGSNFNAYTIANVGSMENKGVEFSINTQPVKNNDLTWNVDFNITYNKNNITNLTIVPEDKNYKGFPSAIIAGGRGGQFSQINTVGYAKGYFYLYKQVYDASGKPLEGVFVDQNEDGQINQDDLYKVKSSIPNLFAGFSSSVNYKKWNAGFVLRASFNNYVYNNNYSQTGVLSQITGNAVLYNASANYLETRFNGASEQLLSDYYIQNGSFLRMDNCNIGYNFGKIFNKTTDFRMNASIQNVLTITKYKGIDPEVVDGIDNNLYPRPRIYALGLSLNF